MLALILARHSSVRDGLLALLEAEPAIEQIVQVEVANPAWEFVQVLCPDIMLIYSTSLPDDFLTFIENVHVSCNSPILAMVGSEEDRKAALSTGADVVVMEGLPSMKLKGHIKQLIHTRKEILIS